MPYELAFEALAPYNTAFDYEEVNGKQVWWYDQLSTIEAGATLFQVNALTAPLGAGGEWVPIATIELVTDLITSTFGDNRLFFSHKKVSHDRKFWPLEWFRADAESDPSWLISDPENTWGNWAPTTWPTDDGSAKKMYQFYQTEYGCPFYWLLEALQEM